MSYEIKTDPTAIVKTAAEIVKKEFEFAGDDLASGETIASVVSVTVDPAGPTISNLTFAGTVAQCTITGGTAGIVYKLTCKVTTTASQTLEQAGLLYVGNP